MPSINTISRSLLLPLSQKVLLPQSLIYFVTSRCNASCNFCLYHEMLNNDNHNELSVIEVEQMAMKYGQLHYLGLSGGEPFIRKDLKALCQAFVDHCNVQIIDIPSNFYYGERMIEFVHAFCEQNKSVTLDLQFSLDNLGKEHDKSRNVKGLFDKAISHFQALYRLKEKYPNLMLKVNIVYLPENKFEIKHMLQEIKKLISFDRIQLTFPHSLLQPEQQATEEQLNDLAYYFELANEADFIGTIDNNSDLYSLGLRSLKGIYRKLLSSAVLGTKNTGSYCEAGKNIVVINEAGDVFPCEILWDETIGNIRDYDYSIQKVLANHKYQTFRKNYLGAKNKCNCTWSCAMNTEVSVNYKYFPQLAFNAFSLRYLD